MLVDIANELDPGKFGVGVKHPRPTLPSGLFLFASWYVPWSGAGRDRIDAVRAARIDCGGVALVSRCRPDRVGAKPHDGDAPERPAGAARAANQTLRRAHLEST